MSFGPVTVARNPNKALLYLQHRRNSDMAWFRTIPITLLPVVLFIK